MVNLFSAVLAYYNAGHFAYALLAPALFLVLYYTLKNKNSAQKDRVLMIIFIVNAALFVSYKIFMWVTYEEFVLLNELPLHLCNFNVILLPVALKTKNKFLLSYLYYIGSLGALAAVFLFDTIFLGKNIFDYGVFVYFLYHSVLLSTGVLIPALRIYTPNLKDILKAHATLLVLATFMHGVNTLFRVTGACTIANYFYTYGMPGNPLLGTLKDLIPVNLIYMLPVIPIAAAVNCLMFLPFAKRVRELKMIPAALPQEAG